MRVISLNAPPSTPEPVTYGRPMSKRPLELSCATSIDPDLGDTVSYVWEQRVTGAGAGVWEQIALSSEAKTTVTVPAIGTNITYRVKAVDNHSAESAYATGSAKTIVYNFPPVISGQDDHKGEIHDPFAYSFTVDDPDLQDVLTVWVYLDKAENELLKIDNAVRNKTYTIDLKEMWEYTPMQDHALIIRAIDDKGGEAIREIRFTRVSDELEVELMEAISIDEMVTTLLPFINYAAEKDASVKILVKNDIKAEQENVTQINYASELYSFINEKKTETPAEFYCYVSIKKGPKKEGITFYGGSFVLNANGIEMTYAKGVRIAPHDITAGGLLSAADDNAMKALNTLSMASASGTGGVNAWEKNAQGSYYKLGRLLICRGEKAVTDTSIWGELEYNNMIVSANTKQAECGMMLISTRLPIHTWVYPVGFASEPFVTATLNDQRKTGGTISIKYMAIGESAT